MKLAPISTIYKIIIFENRPIVAIPLQLSTVIKLTIFILMKDKTEWTTPHA